MFLNFKRLIVFNCILFDRMRAFLFSHENIFNPMMLEKTMSLSMSRSDNDEYKNQSINYIDIYGSCWQFKCK